MDPDSGIAVVIPALDEEESIAGVVRGLLALGVLDEVVVTDNGSQDATAVRARASGATVVHEPRRGYGQACLGALRYLGARPEGPPKVVVFVDGDGSNIAAELPRLVAPVLRQEVEVVIGARTRKADPGSLTPPQRFGNLLATRLLRYYFGGYVTDLGPFRAVSWRAFSRLGMQDQTYGWTVEMQIKALKYGLPMREIDVGNRIRTGGRSKIAGTVRGVLGAGTKIVSTIMQHR